MLESNVKGSVGYFCGGGIKGGYAYLFFSKDANPLEKYNEAMIYFGKFVICRYVNVDDPEKVFTKFKKELSDYEDFNGSVYSVHSKIAMETLKKVSGV